MSSFPFPMVFLSSQIEKITRIEFDCSTWDECTRGGGLEDEIDGDGGAKVQDVNFSGSWAGASGVVDLSSKNILWDDRYNYRLGFSMVYSISNIKLYKNGVLTETQAGVIYNPSSSIYHLGTNLNPGSRVNTSIELDSCVAYPK